MAKRKEFNSAESFSNIISIAETLNKIDNNSSLNNIIGYEDLISIKNELQKKAQDEYKQLKNNVSNKEISNLFLEHYKQ